MPGQLIGSTSGVKTSIARHSRHLWLFQSSVKCPVASVFRRDRGEDGERLEGAVLPGEEMVGDLNDKPGGLARGVEPYPGYGLHCGVGGGIVFGMQGRGWMERYGFWPLALLWLPTGVVALTVIRFGTSGIAFGDAGEVMVAIGSLAVTVPCGLPLALGCRRLWRMGYRRAAWTAGAGLGALAVPSVVVAGLLGPMAIAAAAALPGLPVWLVWLWLAWRG